MASIATLTESRSFVMILPFVEISIDLFDQHWIVIATRKDVLVYLQEVNSFLENYKKLAILVEDDSVAEAETSLNFHDCGGKCR